MSIRPKVGGFPYLAEALRSAGVIRNEWNLPGCQAFYQTLQGPVMLQGTPLDSGPMSVPTFDREALVAALRKDQAGNSTFPEFIKSAWLAGVVRYSVDFAARTVAYYGWNNDEYVESYPAVDITQSPTDK